MTELSPKWNLLTLLDPTTLSNLITVGRLHSLQLTVLKPLALIELGNHFSVKLFIFPVSFSNFAIALLQTFKPQIASIKECHPNPQHSSWSLSCPCVVCMLSEIKHLAALALNNKVAEAVRSCKNTHFLLYW